MLMGIFAHKPLRGLLTTLLVLQAATRAAELQPAVLDPVEQAPVAGLQSAAAQALMPACRQLQTEEQFLELERLASVEFSSNIASQQQLSGQVKKMLLDPLGIKLSEQQIPDVDAPRLRLAVESGKFANAEGYSIEVGRSGISISAGSEAGVFYALVSLQQLCLPAGLPQRQLAFMQLHDAPELAWRGLHLDVSRHFFDKKFMLQLIELMAFYKLNVLHWHLVDGPGWRLHIDKYPLLTTVGAWRVDRRSQSWNWQDNELFYDGRERMLRSNYGGYYSKADVAEIVAHAKKHYITIVPEIEMPGHAYAALISYPQFACVGVNIMQDGLRGRDVFCVGNPELEGFLKDVLAETISMFPSRYLHIGGDEVPYEAWSKCQRCQACMQRLGFSQAHQLQPWFMQKMASYLHAQGRRAIAWCESAEGAKVENLAIMAWRGNESASQALSKGYDVVLTPMLPLYFNMRQSSLEQEPAGESEIVNLFDVFNYSFAPAAAVPGKSVV